MVVGGQFGSEGKGKVAQHLSRLEQARAAVRIGGSNSGHTGYDSKGGQVILRQLPTAALLPDVVCVLGAGSYIDLRILAEEIALTELSLDRLVIDPNAVVIDEGDRFAEANSELKDLIGSTCTGTGASVMKRISRSARSYLSSETDALRPYVRDTTSYLRSLVEKGERIIVEGTQGFGLSVLHSPHYPYVTTRDASAAGAISEAGLSPMDVDRVVLVLRSFPIRVGGNSGPLKREINWSTVALEAGYERLEELTSVTRSLRRVARFDAEIVRRAVTVNAPTHIVLNHGDYVDARARWTEAITPKLQRFLTNVEQEISRPVNWVGIGPDELLSRRGPRSSVRLRKAIGR